MSQSKENVKSLSAAAVAFLDRINDAAVAVLSKLNVVAVPTFRILPAPSVRNARGSSAGKAAQTYYVIPDVMEVNLRAEKIAAKDAPKVNGRALKVRHVLDSKAQPTSHRVAESNTLLLSMLAFASADARDADSPRATSDLVTDAVRGLLFIASRYFPGVSGKVKTLKALAKDAEARGFSITPTRVPMLKDGLPVLGKDGKARVREDWSNMILSDKVSAIIAEAINEAKLPDAPPHELVMDFAAFTRSTRDRAETFITTEARIGATVVKVRLTVAELAKAAAAFKSGELPDELRINIKLTVEDRARIEAHNTREKYIASLKRAEKPGAKNARNGAREAAASSPAIGTTDPGTPRIAPGRGRRPAQPEAPKG